MRYPCDSTRASPLYRDILNPTLDINQLYAKFDSVELSESSVKKISHVDVEDHDDVQNKLEVTDDGEGQQHIANSSVSEAQHRATHSGEVHPEPAAPDANQDSLPPSPPLSELSHDTPTSGEESETHPGQTAHERSTSTPSLPSSHPNPPYAKSSLSKPPLSGHKFSRSTGPSMLEKVISKTRPSFLPPKSRDEDQKHLADWEKMMKRSRAAGTQ
jgi:hypothetical protein